MVTYNNKNYYLKIIILLLLQLLLVNCYLIKLPNSNLGWKANGPQPIVWDRVETDARSFAVVLTNLDRTILPHDIVLDDYVDGTRLSAKISPPRGGFPTGAHFRINFVKSANEPNIIYAQSEEFIISIF